MKKQNLKIFILNFVFFSLIIFTFIQNKVSAVCAPGVVPDPLDPNCEKNLTAGNLINRFLQGVPFVTTFAVVIAIARSAFKIIMAEDVEKRQEAFRGVINASIGAALFYSIWIIIYLIQQFTGAKLIYFN